MRETDLYPVAIIQDRYNGTYSGGAWIAIANFDHFRREEWLMAGAGPWSDDMTAANFWDLPPHGVAVGNTPNDALEHLYEKMLK